MQTKFTNLSTCCHSLFIGSWAPASTCPVGCGVQDPPCISAMAPARDRAGVPRVVKVLSQVVHLGVPICIVWYSWSPGMASHVTVRRCVGPRCLLPFPSRGRRRPQVDADVSVAPGHELRCIKQLAGIGSHRGHVERLAGVDVGAEKAHWGDPGMDLSP